jgi:hypothetical protein
LNKYKGKTLAVAVVTLAAGATLGGVISGSPLAAPAEAAVTASAISGLVEVTSGPQAQTVKNFDVRTAKCPGAKVVVGTGFLSVNHDVMVTDLDVTDTTVSLRTQRDARVASASWNSSAIAYCADRPAGYVVTPPVKTIHSSASEKEVTANCPIGKRVIGTGFGTFNTQGRVEMDAVIPGATTVTAKAFDHQPGLRWTLEVRAICADPMPTRTVAVTDPVQFTSQSKTVEARCPVGTQVTNTSFDLMESLGAVKVIASNLAPNLNKLTTQAAAIEPHNGSTTRNWGAASYAICA